VLREAGNPGRQYDTLFAQGLRSSLSHQILELAKTHGEIKVKEIEEFTGANRTQVGKGRGARYTLK